MAHLPPDNAIAIIGMAARLPGAASIEQFWANIIAGVESITFFSAEEQLAAGVPRDVLEQPDFVSAAPVIEGHDLFDAAFFRISRREAEMMDPQQRVLLELAWETLERAGYAGERRRRLIGVFTGGGGLMSSYLVSPFHFHHRLLGPTGSMQCIGNDKDYLSTRISYKLDLRGPSITVQSACSTSLVAVHLACQSLLAGECEMALAGGVTIRIPQRVGYLATGQALLSPDGHCRPFDADANGTIFGSGAGLVLLKPLAQALADGDHIHAVICGSAVNNDGAAKLSFWATNVEGQTAACLDALAVARVEPRTIGYLEAHGTGTAMGDPVEIFAMTKAYQRHTQDKQFCAIGSVKGNIGHLEAAAGIAGLIKAALALEHRILPPSINFSRPNKAIDFPATPFYVNTGCRPWEAGAAPRRAAVNSLGIGGTNAHLILEEAPQPQTAAVHRVPGLPASAAEKAWQILTISAKSARALRESAERFHRHLQQTAEDDFADVCFTANCGRTHFEHRLAVVARSVKETQAFLKSFLEGKADNRPVRRQPFCLSGSIPSDRSRPVFIFSGEGTLYAGTGKGLYESQPAFRETLQACDALLRKLWGRPLLPLLFGEGTDARLLHEPEFADPALFALQYALCRLWHSLDVAPAAVIGYGLGAYAAACSAGVIDWEQGLRLVAARAELIQNLAPAGSMAAVAAKPVRQQEVLEAAGEAGVWLSAVNSPQQMIFSGGPGGMEKFLNCLKARHIHSRLLPIARPLYSPPMGLLQEELKRLCDDVDFSRPRHPFISTLTEPPEQETVFSGEYWARHLISPVHFAQAVAAADARGYRIFLELGPQPSLLGSGRRTMRQWSGLWLASLEPHSAARQVLLSAIARLYLQGLSLDFSAVDGGRSRRRLPLPTYPFQRVRYWVNAMNQLIRHEQKDRVRLVAFDTTRLVEAADIEQCYREIMAVLEQSEERYLVIDFSRLNFMSSSALGMLIRINKRCKEFKVGLKLCGIIPDIRQAFKLTGLDKVFDIQPNVSEALAAIAGSESIFDKKRPTGYEVG